MFASPTRSALLSGILHAAAIALVLLVTSTRSPLPVPPGSTRDGRDIGRYISLVPLRSTKGGGGGSGHTTPASKGRLPRASLRQFTPPVVIQTNLEPKLPMEPTIVGAMPIVSFGQIGDPNGILGLISAGPGSKGGIGTGDSGGVGPGSGPGAGPGDCCGIGGNSGIKGTVIPPLLLVKIEPEYTEEARKAKLQGTVLLRIEVNERGLAQNVMVRQSLGLGLDDRAVEAVQRWKFRPGSIDGKPGVTTAIVEVNFRLL